MEISLLDVVDMKYDTEIDSFVLGPDTSILEGLQT